MAAIDFDYRRELAEDPELVLFERELRLTLWSMIKQDPELYEQVTGFPLIRGPLCERVKDVATYCFQQPNGQCVYVEKRPGLTSDVISLHRLGNEGLEEFLENHQEHPTDGGRRNPLHDQVQQELLAYPEGYNFSPQLKRYREVELLLRPENQAFKLLAGEEFVNHTGKPEDEGKVWLTAVDNVYLDLTWKRAYLFGVITVDAPEVRERELVPLGRAMKFFHYNWRIEPRAFLVLPRDGRFAAVPYEEFDEAPMVNLDSRLRGIFE